MSRLLLLRDSWLPLRSLSEDCLRGDVDADTRFLVYSNEMTESPNPAYVRDWAAFLQRLNAEPMPATRIAREGPRAIRRTYGPHGIRLELRFDRGDARRRFPMLSVCDFGDSQISLMVVDGPPTPAFRELENALWGVVYDEALRFERSATGSR